jgi:hypothetical protein
MTKRKMKIMSSKAMRIMPTSVMPSKVSELVRNLALLSIYLGSIMKI